MSLSKEPTKKTCVAGHSYPENWIVDSQGKGRCQICQRASWREASRKYSAVLASARKEGEQE